MGKPRRRPPRAAPVSLPTPISAIAKPPAASAAHPSRPLSAFQRKLHQRLSAGQFRALNERLYTCTGAQALALLRSDPSLFSVYHTGYRVQAARWPHNPLDRAILHLSSTPTPLRVADLGCGDARLSASAPSHHTVHSFDLVAHNDRVIACDMAHLPLQDATVDLALFCLSLMGTNYPDFLREAQRVLAPGGWLLVAEVASRFEGNDAARFARAVEQMGLRADPAHRFVSGEIASNAAVADRRQKGGKRRASNAAIAAMGKANNGPSSAFFRYFAFKKPSRTAGKVDSGKGQSETVTRHSPGSFPVLKPCVYKRR